jgi:uncharacterized RDD family membrane protein YckC
MSVMEVGDDLAIAGFWRRIGAFVTDTIILGVIGLIIGTALYSTLAGIGASARLIGFAISLLYFGVLNSRVGEGQTLGNRWWGVRVVGARGEPLSLARSCVRYVVLGIPLFFNNLPLPGAILSSPVIGALLSLMVLGGGLAIVYLYVFNRRTRQSLHDLLVGSYVIRVGGGESPRPRLPVWQGHWVVVAIIALISLGAPSAVGLLANQDFFSGLLPLYHDVEAKPHVMNAKVERGWSKVNDRPATHYLAAQLRLDAPMTDDSDYAHEIAKTLIHGDPHRDNEDHVVVVLCYGYDIGIATGWKRHTYSFTSDELR